MSDAEWAKGIEKLVQQNNRRGRELEQLLKRVEELEETLREIIEIASTATLDWEKIGVRVIEMEAKARGALGEPRTSH